MTDSTHKSYLRDNHGPRVVDSGYSRGKIRGEHRRQRDVDESGKQRSKHGSLRRSSKTESSSHRRKTSALNTSHLSSKAPEWGAFEMDIVGQPHQSIVLGATTETSVMISLRMPFPEMADSYRSTDTSRLMGIVTLVAELRTGERMPVECGTLTGQKMFDSIHSIPEQVAQSLARSQPSRLALGYFSFPDLLIRQHGTYRLRITLMKMGVAEASGASTVLSIDSEVIKVERRTIASGNSRRYQRV